MTQAILSVTEVPIVAVDGQIDPAAVIVLQRRIMDALDVGLRDVVVDLRAVTLLGGPSVGLFCGASRRVQRRGARVVIAGAQPAIRPGLDCELDGIECYTTLRAAVAAAGHAGRPLLRAAGPPLLRRNGRRGPVHTTHERK